MRRVLHGIFFCTLLVLGLSLAPLNTHASGLNARGPIVIEGDLAFTRDNGVVSGSGTAVDPFIIEGWEISGVAATAIRITGTSAYFVIRNVWIHHTADGILFIDVINGRVEDSIISDTGDIRQINTGYAIRLTRSSQNMILDNQIFRNVYGIRVGGSSSNALENNLVKGNLAIGIGITGGSGNVIRNNMISDSAMGDGPGGRGWGVGISLGGTTDGVVKSNSLSSNDIGISTFGDKRILMHKNTILRNYYGIRLSDGEQVSILNNRIQAGWKGVEVTFGKNHTIVGNDVWDSRTAVDLGATGGHLIKENRLVSNSFAGIRLTNTWWSTFEGNVVLNSQVGFFVEFLSRGNLFSGNVVKDTSWYSFVVDDTEGAPNTIHDNLLADSPRGLWITSSSNSVVDGNVFKDMVFPIGLFCLAPEEQAGIIIGDNSLVDVDVPAIVRPDTCIESGPFIPFMPPPPLWSREALSLSTDTNLLTSGTPVEMLDPDTRQIITSIDWGAALQGTAFGRAVVVRNTSDLQATVTITHNLPSDSGTLFLIGDFTGWYRAQMPYVLDIEPGQEVWVGFIWKVPTDASVQPIAFDIIFS